MAMAVPGKFVSWRGRVLTEAGLRNLEGLEENPQYTCELSALDREVLDTPSSMVESSRREDSIPSVSQKRVVAMKLAEILKSKTGALKVAEVAELFGVTPQHIYKMAASGRIPSFRISGSVRFDPDELAAWLKEKQAAAAASRKGSPRVAA